MVFHLYIFVYAFAPIWNIIILICASFNPQVTWLTTTDYLKCSLEPPSKARQLQL